MIAETERRLTPEGKVQNTKCLIKNKFKGKFKIALQEMTWGDVIISKLTDSSYEAFYDKTFEKFLVTVKIENTKKTVENRRNSKIFKNKAKAISVCNF